MVAQEQDDLVQAAQWYTRSVAIVRRYNDAYHLQMAMGSFRRCYDQAAPADQARIRTLWQQANLGSFPIDSAGESPA